MVTQTQLNKHDFSINLQRFPTKSSDKSLRAWDAADEYLIDQLVESVNLADIKTIIVINDSFGALCCAIQALAPHIKIDTFTDSYMSKLGIQNNINNNAPLTGKNTHITVNSSLDFNSKLNKADIVLLKVPRTLAYLDYLLAQLRLYLSNDTKILAGGMVKLITSSVVKLFEKHFPGTKTSLAKKKARLLISASCDEIENAGTSDNYKVNISQVKDEELGFTLYNWPNVFCREQVDIGARFLLKTLINYDFAQKNIIDLGCGNGILGVSVLQRSPNTHMVFVDESFMAIASAKQTLAQAAVDDVSNAAEFYVNHCLSNITLKSVDAVLCNPPFHQQSTVTEDIAWQMFKDAYKVLKPRGQFFVVGNRHLDHHIKLKKLFGNCKAIASNAKFVVLLASKSI
ncbi:methyltransferase [Glaciecola petra]|uniref:Ribosomal RNA large subunit methyltransferase G n=1 Tax=Glaciecola petra TaxID=3075602 RepID=A0ABU2ZL80_9ALTE|nr:methyltransferase [Aestuariibacter sp. P117]MDT0593380.1 methyltransferase [Aestuariibacter sp. P117]